MRLSQISLYSRRGLKFDAKLVLNLSNDVIVMNIEKGDGYPKHKAGPRMNYLSLISVCVVTFVSVFQAVRPAWKRFTFGTNIGIGRKSIVNFG